MQIAVTTSSDDLFTLDVSEDLEVGNFKALCEIESGVRVEFMILKHNNIPLLDDKRSLKTYGISDGSVIMLFQNPVPVNTSSLSHPSLESLDFSSVKVPQRTSSSSTVNVPVMDILGATRDIFRGNTEQLSLLRQNNPRLAEALLSGNVNTFSSVLREQIAMSSGQPQRRLRTDFEPLNAEAQKIIAEQIRKNNVDANMKAAIEYNPETFGTVVMLYINCHVNGFPVKAFIDSGAQTTIMSATCAERCNIMRLIDTRWSGIAKGVGVQRIIGRIHMVQIKIGNDFLTTSFSVLEKQPMDMLLGLDMLKRHQCNIDLKRGVLQIGTTGTETPFLSESDLPACAQLSRVNSNEDMKQLYKNDQEKDAKNVSQTATSSQCGESSSNSGLETGENIGLNQSSQLILPTDSFGEPEVEEIVVLGFTREQAINELRRFNGDKTQATVALFAKSLKF